jgi:hypothetical protein
VDHFEISQSFVTCHSRAGGNPQGKKALYHLDSRLRGNDRSKSAGKKLKLTQYPELGLTLPHPGQQFSSLRAQDGADVLLRRLKTHVLETVPDVAYPAVQLRRIAYRR